MSIATKKGDKGKTSLLSGERIKKSDPQVEAYGVVDELNSWLGLIRFKTEYDDFKEIIYTIQQDLFTAAAQLASRKTKDEHKISHAQLEFVEAKLDFYQADYNFRAFIVPGESELGSLLDISRTICRKAERRMTAAENAEVIYDDQLKSYINRLSDLLFIMARTADERYLIDLITQKVLAELQGEF